MFYCLFIAQSHKIVHLSADFVDFLSAVFWAQNIPLPPFFILLTSTKSIFTNFWHLAPNFTNFDQFLQIFIPYTTVPNFFSLFTTFYHLFLPPTSFYQHFITLHLLLPTCINYFTTFHQSKMILFSFFIFWLALIPPYCWIPCYKY